MINDRYLEKKSLSTNIVVPMKLTEIEINTNISLNSKKYGFYATV